MQEINWIQVLIGFLSGGAFGALIKQFFDNRRNRVQPVGHSIEIKPVYDSNDDFIMNSSITLTEKSKEYKLPNLYIGTIELVNTGLTDFNEFEFGVTCPEHVKIIQVRTITKDRHHLVNIYNNPSLDNQLSSFDMKLQPLNRKDNYSLNVVLTSEQSSISEDDIQISSKHSIKWVKLTSPTEAILTAANKTFIEILASTLSKSLKI